MIFSVFVKANSINMMTIMCLDMSRKQKYIRKSGGIGGFFFFFFFFFLSNRHLHLMFHLLVLMV